MSKQKSTYICNSCGATYPKWTGRCSSCGEWNCLVESIAEPATSGNRYGGGWTGSTSEVKALEDVKGQDYHRTTTGIEELDRVLGGGIVQGSVTLIGGDPGVGKSTLLLQAMAKMGASKKVLYITGEESIEQVALRASRLGLGSAKVSLVSEIELEKITTTIESEKAKVVVIDSIQTVYSTQLQSAPGTVAQVRECAAQLTRYAKSKGAALFIVGHVTKEGALAGPRVLEHMVDTVLYFEGEQSSAFRMVRAFKNRFGAVHELGVFCMGEQGLEEVSNPSSMFLTSHERPVAGSCVLAAMEGNRPFLVEVQALVEDAPTPNAKRSASGIDTNRLQMLLAVLHKHAGIAAFDQNVYLKIVGGVRLTEPAADLAVLLATHSSLTNKPLPDGTIVFGEVGLAGEIRAVQDAETRLLEAAKLGYTQAIIPAKCNIKKVIPNMKVHPVNRVDKALSALRTIRELN